MGEGLPAAVSRRHPVVLTHCVGLNLLLVGAYHLHGWSAGCCPPAHCKELQVDATWRILTQHMKLICLLPGPGICVGWLMGGSTFDTMKNTAAVDCLIGTAELWFAATVVGLLAQKITD